VNFVIRLIVGPLFCDGEGKAVVLSIQKGETPILNKVFYKGKVFLNVIGVWQKGFSEPMWITPALAAGPSVTNLEAKTGLAIYYGRMRIEETFGDLKSLLNFHKLMNKRRRIRDKMVALILITYSIVLIVGESLRARLFPHGCRNTKLFSGPFDFPKLKPDLAPPVLSQAQLAFFQPTRHPCSKSCLNLRSSDHCDAPSRRFWSVQSR